MENYERLLAACLEHLHTQLPEIRDKALMALCEAFLYRNVYEEVWVETDFDTSTYAHPRLQKHRAENYETLKDFLDQLTGQTIPTYVSGAGMSAETYGEWLENFVYHLLGEYAYAYFKSDVDEWLEGDEEDAAALAPLELTEALVEELEQVSVRWMLKHYGPEVQGLRQLAIERQEARQRESELRARRAQQIEKQTRFVLCRDRYTQAEREELQLALRQLAQVLERDDLELYLESDFFRQKVSRSLYCKAQSREFYAEVEEKS